jgi:hypothetical protein
MNPDAQSFGERRGHRLAPLQTNFSRPTAAKSQRLQRPRPTDYPSTNGSEGPVPLQSPVAVKRQSSKTSLRNLFGRDKTSRVPEPRLEEVDESLPEPQTAILSEMPMSPSLMSPRTIDSNPTITSPTTRRKAFHAGSIWLETAPVVPSVPSIDQARHSLRACALRRLDLAPARDPSEKLDRWRHRQCARTG